MGSNDDLISVPLSDSLFLFSDDICQKGIIHPSNEFLKEIELMDDAFVCYHPKGSVKRGPGVTRYIKEYLTEKLPHRSIQLISYIVEKRLSRRIQEMNMLVKLNKKKKENSSMTLRGKKKIAQMAH